MIIITILTNQPTYDDYLLAKERGEQNNFIVQAITFFKGSHFFERARLGTNYFYGNNDTIMSRETGLKDLTTSTGKTISIDINKAKIASNIFCRLTLQQVGTLLNWGLQTAKPEMKDKLGADFDSNLSLCGEKSIVHGRSYLFYNDENTQVIEAYGNNGLNGCFVLADEATSANMIAVRFWQISTDKPMFVEIFERDGKTRYKVMGEKIEEVTPKRYYKAKIYALTGEIVDATIYPTIPVVEFRYDETGLSALTPSLQNLIDRYDIIMSDNADVMEKIKVAWWVFKNYSGTVDDLIDIRNEIERLGIISAGDESDAHLETVDVPFQAVEYSLKLLEKEIYRAFMAYNTDEITGGSLTNVAIKAAMENHLKKVGRWERQQVIRSTRQVMLLANIETADIKFRYDILMNETEFIAAIIECYVNKIIDRETALNKLTFIDPDEIQDILNRVDLEMFGEQQQLDNMNNEVAI